MKSEADRASWYSRPSVSYVVQIKPVDSLSLKCFQKIWQSLKRFMYFTAHMLQKWKYMYSFPLSMVVYFIVFKYVWFLWGFCVCSLFIWAFQLFILLSHKIKSFLYNSYRMMKMYLTDTKRYTILTKLSVWSESTINLITLKLNIHWFYQRDVSDIANIWAYPSILHRFLLLLFLSTCFCTFF